MAVEAPMVTTMVEEAAAVTVEDTIVRTVEAVGDVEAIGVVGVLVVTMPMTDGATITAMGEMIEEATTTPVPRELLLP